MKVNVPKPAGKSPGAGILAKDIITFFDVDDIVSMGDRDSNGVVINDNIVMKPNCYGIQVYATQDSIEFNGKSEGETDNEGFMPSFKFKYPGNKQAIREFKSAWVGRKVIAAIQYCNGAPKDLFGSLCNPMKISVDMKATKDSTGNEFTCTQLMRGDDAAIYNGTLPLAEPKAVLAAGVTAIALVGEGEYQLSGHTTSVVLATVTGASHGMVFTLLGSVSGTAPTLEASAVFITKDGATWNASAGSQITFKAYKSGAAAFVYIEQSRA